MSKRFLLTSTVVFVITFIIIEHFFINKTVLSGKTVDEAQITTGPAAETDIQASTSGEASESPTPGSLYTIPDFTNMFQKKVDYSPLIDQINKYVSDKDGQYGVYFISLTSGQSFGINENDDYVAASTTKVPINLYLFSRIAEKKVNPNRKLVYMEEDYEEGTGSIQYEDIGTMYSIRELSRRSIEESDNVAINMLSRFLGVENIQNYMESIVKHPVDFADNISNPKEMALYLNTIVDFDKKFKKLGNELLNYLENTIFNDRLPLYLPPEIPVAHKIGNQVCAMHDVGIVFAKKPYILAVMTKDINEDQAPEVIANISKLVYDFEEK